MTDAGKRQTWAIIDGMSRIATGLILAVLLWVGDSITSLEARVGVLESRFDAYQLEQTRMVMWRDWWERTVPAMDATQSTRISNLEAEVERIRARIDK